MHLGIRQFVPGTLRRAIGRVRHRIQHELQEHKLRRRIQAKWNKDRNQLPLTAQHRSLYDTLHRLCLRELGEFPELVHCRDFNDRIHWLKLFDQDPRMIPCSDKLQVKEHVKERLGKGFAPETLQMAESFDKLDFDSLPESYVVKCNHDSGTVILVRAPNRLDRPTARARIASALAREYGNDFGEWAYAHIPRRVFIEAMIPSVNEGPPPDAKCHCVDGKVRFVTWMYDRHTQVKWFTLTRDGREIRTLYPELSLTSPDKWEKPVVWDELIRIAETVSQGFRFVRVDLLVGIDRVVVGELTFWPAAGLLKGDRLKLYGDLINFDRTRYRTPLPLLR